MKGVLLGHGHLHAYIDRKYVLYSEDIINKKSHMYSSFQLTYTEIHISFNKSYDILFIYLISFWLDLVWSQYTWFMIDNKLLLYDYIFSLIFFFRSYFFAIISDLLPLKFSFFEQCYVEIKQLHEITL